MIVSTPSKPEFGVNYDIGWAGFVWHDSFIADGIAWFTRRHRKGNPKVDHVFVVTGNNTLVEANSDGVDPESMDEYFKQPGYSVYLRKPKFWTPDLGSRIAAKANTYIGYPYDFGLIAGDAISNSIIGQITNDLTDDLFDDWITRATDSSRAMICDKLYVLAAKDQPELKGLGTLGVPPSENNPQMLFGDDAIFEEVATTVISDSLA